MIMMDRTHKKILGPETEKRVWRFMVSEARFAAFDSYSRLPAPEDMRRKVHPAFLVAVCFALALALVLWQPVMAALGAGAVVAQGFIRGVARLVAAPRAKPATIETADDA